MFKLRTKAVQVEVSLWALAFIAGDLIDRFVS
jgi:hypothetical protein